MVVSNNGADTSGAGDTGNFKPLLPARGRSARRAPTLARASRHVLPKGYLN